MHRIVVFTADEWAQWYLSGVKEYNRKITHVVFHHTYKPTVLSYIADTDHAQDPSVIEAIGRYHMKPQSQGGRGWKAIGGDGYATPYTNIAIGRPMHFPNRAHAYVSKEWGNVPSELRDQIQKEAGWMKESYLNYHSLGIEVVGDYSKESPGRSWDAAIRGVGIVMKELDIPISHVWFHRDVAHKSAGCPGWKISHDWVRMRLAEEGVRGAPELYSTWAKASCQKAIAAGVLLEGTEGQGIVNNERLMVYLDRLGLLEVEK